jgi:hypothetical protein
MIRAKIGDFFGKGVALDVLTEQLPCRYIAVAKFVDRI